MSNVSEANVQRKNGTGTPAEFRSTIAMIMSQCRLAFFQQVVIRRRLDETFPNSLLAF